MEEEIGDLAIPDDVSEEAKPEESKAVIDTEDVIPSTDSVAEVSPRKSSNDRAQISGHLSILLGLFLATLIGYHLSVFSLRGKMAKKTYVERIYCISQCTFRYSGGPKACLGKFIQPDWGIH